MRILNIHIKNINSLKGEFNIDFASGALLHAGIFAITGATGAGKTTILDAITLALYGKVARNKDVKEVLSHGTGESHAEVVFQVFDKKYLASWQIRRARGKVDGKIMNPKRELALWDEDAKTYHAIAEKIREVDLAVEKVSGLDYHRFTRSVLLSQGDFAAFLRADERERSDLLERITGTEIYSQLSIAAFERYREEKLCLEGLQLQLEQLGLFLDEAVDEKQLAIAKKETKETEKEQKKLREQLQIFDRWNEAQGKKAELGKEQSLAKEVIFAFEDSAKQLKRSKALRPHSADIDKIFDWNQQLSDLSSVKKQLSEELSVYSGKEKNQKKALTTFLEKTVIFQKEKVAKEKTFHQVDKINDQLLVLKEQQQALQMKEKEANIALLNKQKEGEILEATLGALKSKLQDGKNWLENNKKYDDLNTTLPSIEALRNQLRDIYKIKDELAKNSSKEQKAYEVNQTQLITLEKSLKEEEEVLRNVELIHNKNVPKDFTATEGSLTKWLAAKTEKRKETLQACQQLIVLEEDYEALLKEQQGHEDHLSNLSVKQQNISVKLLNLLEQRADFKEELAFKKEVYRQQQLIANYEQDRQHLKEGETCPLCFSTEHPFHKHPVQPYVDKAKIEAEQAEVYAAKLQEQERALMQQENECNQEIELLQGNEIKSTSGRLEAQRLKLQNYESRMATVLKETGVKLGQSSGFLSQEILKIEALLKAGQEAQIALERCADKIIISKEKITKLTTDLVVLRNDIKTQKNLLLGFGKGQKEQAAKFLQLEGELNKKTKKYDYQFTLETAKAAFLNFNSKAIDYQKWQKETDGNNQQYKQDEIHFVHLEKEIKQLEKALKNTQEARGEAEHQNKKLTDNISKLMDGQSLEIAKTSLDKQGVDLAHNLNQTRENHQETTKKVTAFEQNLKDKTTQLSKLESASRALNTSLLKKLASLSYTSIEAAKKDKLSQENEDELEQRSIQYNNQLIETERALKEVQKELKKWTPSDKEKQNETTFRAAYDTANEAYEKSLFKYGQLEEKHTQQQKKEQQCAQLLKDIEHQRLLFNRWAQLNELIGQADGKKFRTYAQGLTLQKLVAIANQYLEKLNGRYFIHKKSDTDLELEIIDTYQADNRRSMYTLSGGETFLISLALAMGLSELAGKNAQIHSLFIDEGFGTLDAQSLDLALSTLENLQSEGKTIGIISHLKELKERIGVQIQVHKQSNGFSSLSISG